ncbi:MAG: hypothetical protein R3B13_32965 [Polyangiaceae bacterium]
MIPLLTFLTAKCSFARGCEVCVHERIPTNDTPYRGRAAPEQTHTQIDYGPFPIQLILVVVAVGLVLGGALFLMMGLDHGELHCEGAGNECVYRRAVWVNTRPRTFAFELLKGARTTEVRSKDSVRGQVELDLGEQRLLLNSTSPPEAACVTRQINEHLEKRDADWTVRQENERWPAVAGAVTVLIALGLLWWALHDRGTIRIELSGRTLRWRRRLLGLRLASGELELPRDVQDIVVEWSRRNTFLQHRHALPKTFGQLHAVTSDGSTLPLFAVREGHAMHLEAAARLRDALELPERSALVAAEQARLAAEARPVATPSSFVGLGGRLAAAWMGACLGALGGMALLGVGKILLGANLDDPITTADTIFGAGGGCVGGILLALRMTRPKT